MHEFIQEFRSAVSNDVCRQLIETFHRYEQSPTSQIQVVDKFLTDGGTENERRTKDASVIYLNPEVLQAHDPEFLKLVQICIDGISRCIGEYIHSFGPINLAPVQVDQVDLMRYDKGTGFYGRHIDAGSRALQHRVLSFVLYLNDVEEGGETEFPLQNKRVSPEAGKLVVFPAYFCFVHGSRMTISGPKYVLVAFSSFAA